MGAHFGAMTDSWWRCADRMAGDASMDAIQKTHDDFAGPAAASVKVGSSEEQHPTERHEALRPGASSQAQESIKPERNSLSSGLGLSRVPRQLPSSV